ncbi:zinc-ribbon domain-containing protein [Tepidimonas sp. HKU77]|uniref:zinc-ribbon domain-containing protein n=1 Tax=Tepidimonas sp. HKU77 TaxID=3414503 RepID=UPI003C7C5F96
MSFITRCPSCGTAFKVVADQLKIADGWVRCGRCQHVFDATLDLEPASVPLPTEAPRPATPDPPPPPAFLVPRGGGPRCRRRSRHGAPPDRRLPVAAP